MGIAKAVLAAALLNCGLSAAWAEDISNSTESKGQWLKDGTCALFGAGAYPSDTARWTGSCADGYADGLGTATFTHDGQTQSFTAYFTHGMIPDGHVISRWGDGWSYSGDMIGGRFNGEGILTTDAGDRFEGQWADGKMAGFGVLLRANGERYAGDWKDDRPNGDGELRHADGTIARGVFQDGKLIKGDAPQAIEVAQISDQPNRTGGKTEGPFTSISGKTMVGVDGSSIALTLIEGGMELQLVPADSSARKTTFTFMTDRMGTVVEESGGRGSSVTGFFRLTAKGVEVRYADGRSAMLSANADGGVQMALESDAGPSCSAWYPAGHLFSDGDKKIALNAYAGKLGLPVAASDPGNACAAPLAANIAPPPSSAHQDRHADVKAPTRIAKASYHIGDYQPGKELETVGVKNSEIHLIDGNAASPATTPAAH